jgi:hypothetical protein
MMTEIGKINRCIEKSVADIVKGKRGATSKAIGYARQREKLLSVRPFEKENKI